MVTWPAALPREDGPPIVEYQLFVNQELVTNTDPENRFCDLAGLIPGESYLIQVRAVDEGETGSGLLTTTVVAPAGSEAGGAYCAIGLPPIEM